VIRSESVTLNLNIFYSVAGNEETYDNQKLSAEALCRFYPRMPSAPRFADWSVNLMRSFILKFHRTHVSHTIIVLHKTKREKGRERERGFRRGVCR
jgi:hypothetical protein